MRSVGNIAVRSARIELSKADPPMTFVRRSYAITYAARCSATFASTSGNGLLPSSSSFHQRSCLRLESTLPKEKENSHELSAPEAVVKIAPDRRFFPEAIGQQKHDVVPFDAVKFVRELKNARRAAQCRRGDRKKSAGLVRLNCPSCSGKHTLHVNPVDGEALCTHCHSTGNMAGRPAGMAFDDFELTSRRLTNVKSDFPTNSASLDAISDEHFEDLFDDFRLPSAITRGTLVACGVRQRAVKDITESLLFPRFLSQTEMSGVDVLYPNLLNGPVWVHGDIGEAPGMFGYNLASSHKTVVLTKSVWDALAVVEGSGLPAVALPHDCEELDFRYLAYLERFTKVVVWFPNDGASRDFARSCIDNLGRERCFLIRSELASPLAELTERGAEEIVKRIKETPRLSSDNLVDFAMLRKEIYTGFFDEERSRGVQWKRLSLLNAQLKGFRPGELTVFTGPTGCGKTTFLSLYSLDLCVQGVRTLWGSFEIRNERLLRIMLTQFAQKNLQKLVTDSKKETELESPTEECPEFEVYANEFEKLPLQCMNFFGSTHIDRVADTIKSEVTMNGVQHVIIDNLQFMMGSEFDSFVDKFAEQDKMFSTFRKLASDYNVHVTLVIHPRKEQLADKMLSINSIYGGVKASQEADNVLILQDLSTSPPFGQRFLQIVKNRYAGLTPMLKLSFHDDTYGYTLSECTELDFPSSKKKKQPG